MTSTYEAKTSATAATTTTTAGIAPRPRRGTFLSFAKQYHPLVLRAISVAEAAGTGGTRAVDVGLAVLCTI